MDASLRNAQRLLGSLDPDVYATDGPGPTLETLPAPAESPRLVKVRSLEGATLRARPVPGVPQPAFAAFLDGIQSSHVAGHYGIFPIIHGAAAAVIRERRDRRLATWQRLASPPSLYVPCGFMPSDMWMRISRGGFRVVDTTGVATAGPAAEESSTSHPTALAERAVHFVQAERERLERALAERWCERESAPLYIDGGLSGSELVATARCTVGVVKRHRILYLTVDRFPVLAGLRVAERTTAFEIAPVGRTPVVSWYLRLRDPAGQDPIWGLVRVEVADRPDEDLSERADEMSRWVLAERAPIPLPDPRWHTLAYGIYDCEEFLRATI